MDGGSKEKEEGSINYGFQKKQRTEVKTNLLMVHYSSISGVAKESVETISLQTFGFHGN